MSYTEEDRIGRKDFVNKISSLVDNLQKDEHFCLALNGEWGSGKSYVMDMLREKFEAHPEYIVINYDAWNNNFYSDPLIAILYCVLDSIKEYAKIFFSTQEKVKYGILKTLKSWGEDALSAMKQAGGVSEIIARAIEGISNVITSSGKLSNNELLVDYQSYQSLLNEVKKQLNNLVETKIYNDRQTKLIIMVDEIDRCLPNEQLLILERLHYLFEIKNTFVIVALNQACVARTVNQLYVSGGDEYLRKFFDMTYNLDMNADIFLEWIIGDISSALKKIEGCDSAVKGLKRALLFIKNSPNKLLDKVDNRELKKYRISIENIINEFGYDKLTQEYAFFIVLASFMRRFISTDFLVENEIRKRQTPHIKSYPRQVVDYIAELLSIKNGYLPHDLSWDTYNHYAIECFNEIIFYSVYGQKLDEKPIKLDFGVIKTKDCLQLRELVVKYCGEMYENNKMA